MLQYVHPCIRGFRRFGTKYERSRFSVHRICAIHMAVLLVVGVSGSWLLLWRRQVVFDIVAKQCHDEGLHVCLCTGEGLTPLRSGNKVSKTLSKRKHQDFELSLYYSLAFLTKFIL